MASSDFRCGDQSINRTVRTSSWSGKRWLTLTPHLVQLVVRIRWELIVVSTTSCTWGCMVELEFDCLYSTRRLNVNQIVSFVNRFAVAFRESFQAIGWGIYFQHVTWMSIMYQMRGFAVSAVAHGVRFFESIVRASLSRLNNQRRTRLSTTVSLFLPLAALSLKKIRLCSGQKKKKSSWTRF
jgi:hypothetical protein